MLALGAAAELGGSELVRVREDSNRLANGERGGVRRGAHRSLHRALPALGLAGVPDGEVGVEFNLARGHGLGVGAGGDGGRRLRVSLERSRERGGGARGGHRASLRGHGHGGRAPAAHVLADNLGGVGGGSNGGALGGKFHRRGDAGEVPAEALLPHAAWDGCGRVGDRREGEGVR